MEQSQPAARTGLILAVVAVGTFLAPLDSSIVNIALPSISAEFGADVTAVGWVASAYLLTTASLVLTMGRLGDVWGLRRVYVLGFVIFGAGSLACALAPSLGFLVAARVAQALGAAMIFATGPAIVTNAFPLERRGRALGGVAFAVSAGLMAGPTLGGLLLSVFSWHAIFIINIPLAIIVATLSWRVLPEDSPEPASFDVGGAALITLALVAFLLALSLGDDRGWGSPEIVGLLALSVACVVAFVALERRVEHPMLDLTLLDNWAFSAGALSAILLYLAIAMLTFLLPFLLLLAVGLEPWSAGLVMAATPALMAFVAPAAGRLSDAWGSRGLASVGLVVVALSLWTFSVLVDQASAPLVAILAAVTGLGAALFGAPNTSAVMSETPKRHRGIGSAVVANARNVGMAVGIAAAGAIVAAGIGDSDMLSRGELLVGDERAVFLTALANALRFGGAVALIGAVVSWSRGGGRRAPEA